MKKKILYLLILIFVFALASCKKEEDKNTNILEEFEKTLNIQDTLTGDLNLKESYTYKDKTINATFESSDKRILTNDGKYYLCLEDSIVSLTATYTMDDQTLEKTYDLTVNKSTVDELLDKAYLELKLPDSTEGNLDLVNTLKYGKNTITVTYASNDTNVLKNNGEISLNKEDKDVSMMVTLKCSSKNQEKTYQKNIKILSVNQNTIINALKELNYNGEFEEDLTLVDTIDYNGITLNVSYTSKNTDVLKDNGKIIPANQKTKVDLEANVLGITYTYSITVMPMSDELCITKALEEVFIPNKISSDIILPTSYSYGVSAKWESSDQSKFSNDGKLSNSVVSYTNIELKLTLIKGETKSETIYNCVIGNEEHMYLDKTFEGTLTNLEIVNGKMQLISGEVSGTYIGKEISTKEFNECIGSYAATSSKDATCELLVRVKSNNKWSKYFTYGEWGQGLKNVSVDQSDTYFKLSTDEIMSIGSNVATAFQLKLNVKRKDANIESPKVSLLACSLKLNNYSYKVDISSLPKEVKADVPKLHQGIVPVIGGSICSATTSTMLLKYKGHNFEGLADYEHEYIAYIVKDYGNDIFGNWVYNTIAIGSYGENAYVKRIYSVDELIYHLATVGPVGCSVKGYVINGVKDYNTAGHLIVVTGYKINNDGSRILYINDPNVPSVSVQMTENNFNNINRNVYYVVE